MTTMPNFGRNTQEGFLPPAPSLDDLLKRIGIGDGGWSAMGEQTDAAKAMADSRAAARSELLEAYAALVQTPAGLRVVEDILDQSLRRAPCHPGGKVGIEEQTAYMLERMGQNGLATYIVKMIHDGRAAVQAKAEQEQKNNQ